MGTGTWREDVRIAQQPDMLVSLTAPKLAAEHFKVQKAGRVRGGGGGEGGLNGVRDLDFVRQPNMLVSLTAPKLAAKHFKEGNMACTLLMRS